MTASSRKMLRDFWQERTRSALVVLAIAIGIAAFAAVLASYAILTRALNRGYLATNPASATLYTDSVDDALIAAILSDGSVSDAEPRRTVGGRIRVGPAEWRNLMLFVVKDYGDIRISRLEPQAGAWPPGTGELLIERDAMQVAKARIGDTVTIRTNEGSEGTLRLTGSVKDVGQAQARMENIVYGYITLATLAQLGEEPYLDQVKILAARDRFDESHVRRVAEDVRKLVEDRGHPVRRVDVPAPGKHPHADLMGMLLLAKSTFGLFILVLSGILVVNLLTALMAAQVRQIGTMKAVGGTRWQIARIYYGQAALLGVAAIVVAVPLAVVGTRVLCHYQARFLNFDIDSFAVPFWVYAAGAAVGVVVPLLAAAVPVWRGTAVSVLRALSDYGVHVDTARRTRRAGRYAPLSMAVRNTFRHRGRLVLTLATLAAGGLFFMTALNVRSSMIATLDGLFAARKYDVSVGLGEMVPAEKAERAVRGTRGIRAAEGWISTEGALAKDASHPASVHGGPADHDRFSVFAVPVPSKMLALDLVEGRDLRPGDTNAIVVNGALAAKGLRVGETVSLRLGHRAMPWRVVGIAREAFSPATGYVPLSYVQELGGFAGQANSVRLILESTDRGAMNRVVAELDRALEREGARALTSRSKADSRFGFDQHMLMIYVFLIVIACVIAAVGGLGLTTTVSLNVLERRREMGVFRAIGATPAVVCWIFIAEALFVGVASWALAAIAAWPISRAVGNALSRTMFQGGLDFVFDSRGLLLWLAITLVVAAVAGFVPSWSASRTPIREAIGYE